MPPTEIRPSGCDQLRQVCPGVGWYDFDMAHKTKSSHRRNQVVLGDRGRIVLPAEVRRELGLEPGCRFRVETENDGTLRLRPYAAIAKAGLGMFADVEPRDVSMVDELIAERRAEAKREEERYADR